MKEKSKPTSSYYSYDYTIPEEKIITQLDYDIRKDTNCVKSTIKR